MLMLTGCSWAKLSELRQYVDLFRQSGKFSIAYMSAGGEKECAPHRNLSFGILTCYGTCPYVNIIHLEKCTCKNRDPTVKHCPLHGRDASPIQLLGFMDEYVYQLQVLSGQQFRGGVPRARSLLCAAGHLSGRCRLWSHALQKTENNIEISRLDCGLPAGSFLRGVLDKIGVEPQVERIGKYKSAGDQLLRCSICLLFTHSCV